MLEKSQEPTEYNKCAVCKIFEFNPFYPESICPVCEGCFKTFDGLCNFNLANLLSNANLVYSNYIVDVSPKLRG